MNNDLPDQLKDASCKKPGGHHHHYHQFSHTWTTGRHAGSLAMYLSLF